MKLFELAGKDDANVFSPYCWRIRMALAHKNMIADCLPWRFTEKDVIRESGQGAVPVLKSGERLIHDSWDIACYLDDTYPDRPLLFEGETARAQTLFFKHWAEQTIHPAMVKIIIMDVFNALHDKDKEYFRASREARFGMPLEEFEDKSESQVEHLGKLLSPARAVLKDRSFLCGSKPGFADYILFAVFQWARCVSETSLLQPTDPLYFWRDRVLRLYDGLALKAPGHQV